jgi:hypothetical protein
VPYVAFYAAINGGHHGVENGKTINFDDVETNLGNEYNSSTGVVIARTPGIDDCNISTRVFVNFNVYVILL